MPKLIIIGDSHSRFCFDRCKLPCITFTCNSLTMHRVGRDNVIPGISEIHKYGIIEEKNMIFTLIFGEVDARCHVSNQVRLGRDRSQVCETLVKNYISAIQHNIPIFKKIIVCGVGPAWDIDGTEKFIHDIYEEGNYPAIGTRECRKENRDLMNSIIKRECEINGYIFFEYPKEYCDSNGFLDRNITDDGVHIKDNSLFLESFYNLVNSI